jgi:hypothetical protein
VLPAFCDYLGFALIGCARRTLSTPAILIGESCDPERGFTATVLM